MKDAEKLVLKYLSYFLPLTFIPIGIPLALKLIAPGGSYGFRTTRTLANPEIWYSVNFAGGVSMIGAGLLSTAFIFLIHRGTKLGSIRKLVASYVISITILIMAIILAFWLA